jgi:hypothetical protein
MTEISLSNVSFYQPSSSVVSYRNQQHNTLHRKPPSSCIAKSKPSIVPPRDFADQEVDRTNEVDRLDDYVPTLEELLSRPIETVSVLQSQDSPCKMYFDKQYPEAISSISGVSSDQMDTKSSMRCGDSHGKKAGPSFSMDC